MPEVYDRWGRRATLPPGVTRLYRRDGTAVDFGGVTPPVPSGKTLSDFKWVPFGDSITDVTTSQYDGEWTEDGSGWTLGGYGHKYHDWIREATGITVYNYSDGTWRHKKNDEPGVVRMGHGGTGFCTSGTTVPWGDHCFYRRMEAVPTDADVITIFGSVNDWKYHNFGFELGTPTDGIDDLYNGKPSYAGFVNECINVAQRRCPNAKIILIGEEYFNAGTQSYWRQATNMNRQIAELRGLAFYDLYDDYFYGKEPNNPYAEREVMTTIGGTITKIPSGTISYKKVASVPYTERYSKSPGDGHPNNRFHGYYLAPKIASIIAHELGVDPATLPESLRCDPLIDEREPITCTGITAAWVGDPPTEGDVIDRTNFMITTKWSDGTTRLSVPYTEGMGYDDTLYNNVYFAVVKNNQQASTTTLTLTAGDNTFWVLYGSSSWFDAARSEAITVHAEAAVPEVVYVDQIRRTNAQTAMIPAGAVRARVQSIGGRSFRFNQLVNENDYYDVTANGGITAIVTGRRVQISGRTTTGCNFFFSLQERGIQIKNNHKYLITGIHSVQGFRLLARDGATASYPFGTMEVSNGIFTSDKDAALTLYLNIGRADDVEADVEPQMIDLTDIFGAGNEPATVAAATTAIAALGIDVSQPQPYDPGSIRHTSVQSVTFSGAGVSPVSQPIPSAVLALPGYGWGVGTASNHIERTADGWQYVQEVGSVDLGNLTWALNSGTMYCHFLIVKANSTIIADKYVSTPPKPSVTNVSNGEICTSSIYNRIMIHDDAYTTAAEFKTAMSGVYAYYEMEEPITTDITELMGEALPEIELAPGVTNVSFNSETGAAVTAEVLYRYPEGTEVPPCVDETAVAALMSLSADDPSEDEPNDNREEEIEP